MKSIIQITSVTIAFVAILLISYTTNAGGPEGHIESIERNLEVELKYALSKEGYRHGKLKHMISAYLWDNRNLLKSIDIPQHREVDLMICVMTIKGIAEFKSYTNNKAYMDWCMEHVK